MTLTLQDHQSRVKVFKNRLTLNYEDPEIEKVYYSRSLDKSSNINIINTYISTILVIFSLVNIFTFKNYYSNNKIFPTFIGFLYTGIILNFIGLIISISMRKCFAMSKKLSFIVSNLILLKNFFILNIYLYFSSNLYDDLENLNHSQVEIYVFLRIFSVILNISYVWFLLKNFKMMIILNFLILLVQLLIIKFGTQSDSDYQIMYFCLISIITNCIAYYNESRNKINFLIWNMFYNEIKKYSEKITKFEPCYRCNNLRHSFFTANLDGRVTYANNSMTRMMTKNDKRLSIEEFDEMIPLNKENNIFVEFSEFEIFCRNRQPKISYDRNDDNPHIEKEEQKILHKIKNLESMENYVKSIFGNMTLINEEISFSDPKLYEYLNKIKKDNKNSTQQNSVDFNRQEFELTDLIKTISPIFPERNIKEKKTLLIKSKSEGMSGFNQISENNLFTNNNMNDNSEVHILKVMTTPQLAEETIKNSTIVQNSEFQLNIIEAPNSDALMDIKENTVFLGKTSLCVNNDQEEFYIYYSLDPDSKEIQFMLEDISNHLVKERKEIANICRSLYLSKFSHELKNPLCNLLEVISNINDDLNTIKIKKVLNPKKKNSQSGSERDSDSIVESSESSSLSENSDETEVIKKIKNSPLPEEVKENKQIKNRIIDNVKMLKCIGDMMMLIFQDFTFYSDLFGNEKNNKLVAPTSKNSNMKISTDGTSVISNRKSSFLFGDSPVVKSTGITSKEPSLSNKLSTLRFASYKNDAKSCKFKEIIEDVIEIFNTKLEIENKKSKLSIELKYDKNLPYSIDCDKNLFKSMIFNILYHLYITTLSGKIEIWLKLISSVGSSNEILKKLNFEISVTGIINFNCDHNLNIELHDASFDSDLIISSGEESNTVINSNNKSIIPRVKNSNKSFVPRGKNSSNKLGFKNLKLNLSSARRASCVFKNSKRDRANSVVTNHFAMKNILQTGCSLKRNSAVDKFNRNFQYNIFLIYSKKLGIKVNFEKNNSNLKVFLTYDLPMSSDTLNIHASNFTSFYNPSTYTSQENSSSKKVSEQQNNFSKFKYKTGSSKALNINVPSGKKSYEKQIDNGINEVILKIPSTASPKNMTNSKSSKKNVKSNFQKGPSIEINKPTYNKKLLSPPLNYFNIQKDNYSKSKHERRKKSDSLGSTVVISNGEVFDYPQFIQKYQKMKEILNNNSRDSIFNDTVTSKNIDKTVVINNGHLVINHQYFLDSNHNRTQSSNLSESKTKVYSDGRKKLRLSIPPQMPNCVRKKSVLTRNYNFSFNTLRSNSVFSHQSNTGGTPLNLEVISRIQMENSTINLFRVLLCDDEMLIRKTLQRFFTQIEKDDHKFSFEIEHAENGFECLNQIYSNHLEGKYFDLLIIDETMPFFKGSQITNLLKSMMKDNHFKNITIVSFTSYDAPEKIEYIYSQGADFVISKPMKFEDFKLFFFEELYQTEILV